MSYNQKPPGPSGSSGTGIGGSAPNGPNNQTPQQVAKTLAGIQQQMQNLVHGQNALPQSTPADLNAFFQQQRFQNMFKQQQQQLLQQHFQQQMQQQQNKDRGGSGGGGEPLALTRTPAAAELLNKTYQQHHQQQPNGSSAPNPTLASVNQQIQQQLQAFPPNIMQQLQAFQYQMQQQQQQHPQQQQHHTQPPLQQAHQQAQSGQHQTPQHPAVQQQLHGQTHQQQQKALTTAAAAHMQQLQQSLQQKYLSAAAAANQPAVGGNKMSATPPPPPLTNQIKPPSLPPSTQITPVPPVTIGVGLTNASSSVNSVLAAISSLPAPSASKQVPPSISLVPAKQPATSPTFSGGHQQNKFVAGTAAAAVPNKASPMVSAIPAPFPTHYQKPSTAAATIAGANSSSPLITAKSATTSDNNASKSPQTTLSSKQQIAQQPPQVAANTSNQATKVAASTSVAASTLNSSQTSAQKPTQMQTPEVSNQPMQQQKAENGNKNSSIPATGPTVKDPKPSEDVAVARIADNSSEVTKPTENATKETQPILAADTKNSPAEIIENNPAEPSKSLGSSEVETATVEVSSSATHLKTDKKEEQKKKEETKEKILKIVDQKPEEPVPLKTVEEKKEIVENSNKETQEIPSSAKTNEDEVQEITPADTGKTIATPLLDNLQKDTPVIHADKEASLNATETNSTKEGSPISITALKPTSIASKDAAPIKDAEKLEKTVEKKVEIEEQNISIGKPKSVEPPKEKIEKPEKTAKKDEKQHSSTVAEETSSETKVKKAKQENMESKAVDTPSSVATVKVKAIENVSSSETPVRKQGRQARIAKATSVVEVTPKAESQLKRGSREERRNSKIKAEVYTESSPPSTPIDTLSKSNDRKSQRHRLKTILYQSPLPELAYITKLSASEASNSPKPMSVEDKLIVFYKNEYMAVRNAEGTFYLCQTMQNVYRTSPRISIRWLSEDKKDSSIFIPDFYDHTDIECVLTTVELKRVEKGQLRLPKTEKSRIESILKKAIDVEKGLLPRPDITEENPDGLDISLYKDESQIEKRTSAGSTPSSSGRKSRRSGIAAKSSTPTTDGRRKRGFSIVGGNKSPNKKRKTLIKKKKSTKKNSSDEEDVSSDEESDAEYKPNQKKANTSHTSKLPPRAQRSPLAKARAASPITPTSSKTKTPVPQTSSSNTSTANNRIDRANKRKSALEIRPEISTPTPAKKLGTSNAAKSSTLKSKAHESAAEATNRKLHEKSSNIMDNSPSTSAGAAGSGGTRPTRNRK